MKVVQMTLDEDLVAAVDRVAKKLGTSRSAFTRQALREAVERARLESLERKHRQGYLRMPVRRGEFSSWEPEQVWTEPREEQKFAGPGPGHSTREGPS
jgi:Arc/MetJ family transcription regulator